MRMLKSIPHLYTRAIVIGCIASLVGCATATNSKNSSSRSKKAPKSAMPKVPPRIMPGGNGDNWRYLGTTSAPEMADEINESSIKVINPSAQINSFQDRKTIVDTTKFDYQGISPAFKYSLSWWKIDCLEKQYLIDSSITYDEYGKQLKKYNINSNQWSPVSNDSLAKLQYNYVCLGVNRTLGY